MARERQLELVHLLRAVTVDFDLAAGRFAARNGLHATDLRALIALLDAGRAGVPATPGRLGRELGLRSASTTALLDRLEGLGHIRRERDPGDRRRVLLTVDENAIALGEAFFGSLIDGVIAAAGELDDVGIATVRRFLLSVRDVARDHADGEHPSDPGEIRG
ncbi:MarR family transcriptional regulator [Amycolatopsis antarctica]|uniref:MarR family transcriptional regulator n=1 Tax=Amycolatopsis antarctica TaxID=1854586 RepID=A0A263D6J9_9PSEU|nr:MarR family transcriptional regulator [Amycolatopsis antarctica]OZM73035.1 MarR family transcriptional regulator [Amycolatopsis antarctica]